MSRSLYPWVAIWLIALPANLAAQDAAVPPTIEEAVEAQRQAYGPPNPRRSACGVADASGDIVVCAQDSSEFRVESSRELDPTSHEALYDGLPRAPQLDGGYCAECPKFGWVPPPVLYIDVAALPAAPAGSDAERVANGEISER